ncbi:phosphocarrier protein NPr/phosphocarrier protein [Allopseudospirillum japonicum]|uniref:Phosphocarrier protein NPr/phosphocarrier protein n=1 Tax=Allopseudospirillum japonicum TaxID=64971 RepID=A0A1H6Q9W9_9GAMM|nr:HPr family phosphocarrier protein [Allopseudospirillum japonicum]SEI40569.1 phosphocarrier protein NPr/phosphocarrier protein [Allopseudospirillum japonicum]
MLDCDITLVNKKGLHARAATRLVEVSRAYQSQLTLFKGAQSADTRNIMALLMLAAPCGTQLKLHAQGEDEADALAAVVALIEDGFGEDD